MSKRMARRDSVKEITYEVEHDFAEKHILESA
jgi:hypothetical protein